MAYSNYGLNGEQKIRINLSAKAMAIIDEDIKTFNVNGVGTFINTVFTNFRDEAKSSITLYLRNKEEELIQKFKINEYTSKTGSNVSKDSEYSKFIKMLVQDERQSIEHKIKSYLRHSSESRLYRLNNENTDYLINDCLEDENGPYSRPSLYVKCIIEEYCELPFIDRERIYRADIFKDVENACRNHYYMKVKVAVNNKETVLLVKPYKIMADPLETQSYLVCLTRQDSQINEEMKLASFNMYRLRKPSVLTSRTFSFSQNTIADIEKKVINYSPAYLTYGQEEIKVRLTENGKKTYLNKLFSRPVKDEEKSTDCEYVFTCSPHQAFNYFFSFGKDVEIISPQSLRELFACNYKNALSLYEQPANS